MGKMELLAPAGGMRELKAAVQSGADAVYLGAAEFSARAGAGNFDDDELAEAVRYCHLYGVKVHCALNTLIKEDEFEAAVEAAKRIYDSGVDAMIIQDIGLAAQLHRILPDIELHASTQMTVTSLEGVKYLAEHGFSRVVLARELSMKEIEEIVKGTDTEIEVFIHGAICMSYSGQCLMSSVLGGRSGNRGRCAQPCRLKYELEKNGEVTDSAYVLSPKDMALIDRLSELDRLGVASLKIEGRLKSAEYVSAVVGVYRKYIDSRAKVTDEDRTELKKAFSRSGFTDGYFTGKLGRQMMAHNNPANNSGSEYSAEAKERAAGKVVRRVPINIFASLAGDDVLRVTAYDNDGNYASAEGSVIAEDAVNRALTGERLAEQLAKLGQTPFEAVEVSAEVDEGITIPIKDINETRRKLCSELENRIVKMDRRPALEFSAVSAAVDKPDTDIYLTAEVMTFEQGKAVLESGNIRRLFAPAEIAGKLREISSDTEVVTKTADIFRPEQIDTDKVSVSSPAAMRYYGDKAVYGEFRLNIYNSFTAAEFGRFSCITLSPELNLKEIARVTENISTDLETEIIGYGRIPLMLMRNCPIKALGKCQHGVPSYLLKDRKGMEFPLVCQRGNDGECRSVLLNSKPVFTADIISSLKKIKINCIRLNFTVENSRQCGKIISVYKNALSGKEIDAPETNTFTRGHLKRGVI